MIKGVHAMFYAPNADELRVFLRDKLGLPWSDVGEGWLIFDAEGEVGCHPNDSNRQEISFYCDDIHRTVDELKAKGVEFATGIEDHGYGLVTMMHVPGGTQWQLYQPKYRKTRR